MRKAPTETQNVVSYLVIIDVDNLDGKLLPGMTANVDIITGIKPDVLRVPTAALRFHPKAADQTDKSERKAPEKDKKPQPVLYVAGTDKYKPVRREVTTGIEGDEYTEIVSGAKAGDVVLIRTKSLKPKTPKDEDSADENDSSAS